MAVEVNEIMVVEVEEITVVEVDEIERIEAERREIEVERRKEMERLVPGMDDEDLKALLRVFDKVSQRSHSTS